MIETIPIDEQWLRAAVPVLFGVMYATYHTVDNLKTAEGKKAQFEPAVFGTTVLVSTGAALIIVLTGEGLSFGALDILVPVLIPTADDYINKAIGWTEDYRDGELDATDVAMKILAEAGELNRRAESGDIAEAMDEIDELHDREQTAIEQSDYDELA